MKTLLTIAVLTLLITSCKKKNKDPEDTTPQPVTSIGATYAGGTVFYLSEDGQHGLVMTSNNIDTCKWYEGTPFLIGTTSYQFGEGLNNTNEVVTAQGSGNYAAKVCQDLVLNGYSDWYLPSKNELLKIEQANFVFNVSGKYWSSTEDTYADYACYTQLGTGMPFIESVSGKGSSLKVRAVRNF